MLTALTDLVARSRRTAMWTVVGWLVVVAVLPPLAPTRAEVENNRGQNDPPAAAESMRAAELSRQAFPDQQGLPAVIVLRNPAGLARTDLAEARRISDTLNGPGKPPRVLGVVSLTTRPQARQALVSRDGTTTTILVPIAGEPTDDAFTATVDRIREIAGTGRGGLEVSVTGPAGIVRDTLRVMTSADVALLVVTLGLVLVLLLVIYRSPVLALIPLLAVGVALGCTEAIGALLADAGLISVNAPAASIVTVLLFGVGTDYCLFVVARYREELATAPSTYAAMGTAMRRVGKPLLSSAATVTLGLLTLLLTTLPALRGFGPYLALAVVVMLACGLTLVPALIVLLGRAALWPQRLTTTQPAQTDHSLWDRAAGVVLRRPLATLASATLLLAALATGMAGYGENHNPITSFRTATESHRGQQLLQAAFPPGELAPTSVVIDGAGADLTAHPDAPDAIEQVTRAIAAVPGVLTVTGPTRPGGAPNADPQAQMRAAGRQNVAPDGSTARLSVVYADDPYATPALERTEQVRSVARTVLAGTSLRSGTILVGGESASKLDIAASTRRDLLVVVPVTLLAIGLVLGLLLRSVGAPLYLIATIVASFFATLGLTVLVVVGLLGDEGLSPLVAVYVFVFLVALGVDYNILLMSRIREEVRARGFADGLRHALTRTGGVITAAGLILAATFGALMSQPFDALFQFGFAMCAGILLDTFVVRGLLVPAIVRLLTHRSWWPTRLDHPGATAASPEPSQPTAPHQHARVERCPPAAPSHAPATPLLPAWPPCTHHGGRPERATRCEKLRRAKGNSDDSLFDWYGNGEVEALHGGVHISQASWDYVKPFWEGVSVTVIGRHLFDITNGWEGVECGALARTRRAALRGR
jgi:putative drug exporter of the RND superfamily